MTRPTLFTALALVAAVAPLTAQNRNAPRPNTVQAPTQYVLAPAGNEARYRIMERLAANTIDNEVIGKTTAVTGMVTIKADGKVDSAGSKITIDLKTLTTDRSNRDRYVQRNTLHTEQFPTAVLTIVELKGLPAKLPTSGTLTLTLVGELTMHGVTKPTTWAVTATASATGLSGLAKTSFTFAEFGLTQPRVPIVARVDDLITLEYEFAFVKSADALGAPQSKP